MTATFTAADFERAVGQPIEAFPYQCHAAALALVRSGVFEETGRIGARVARGTCPGVGGQHSWVVLGDDCYDPCAEIIDPTLWSYDTSVTGVFVAQAGERPHEPFGTGSIWAWGKPEHKGGETIELDTYGLSSAALMFLKAVGPLDLRGWAQLAHAPVGGWPAGEIFERMYQDDRLAGRIPIDIVGMTTDLNPGGLYLYREEAA